MKQNRLYLVCLCAVLGLSFTGCGEDSDKSGSCSPTTAEQDCGDPNHFYCDAMSKSCKRFIPEHCSNGKTDTGLETAEDCGGACVSEAYVATAQNKDYRQTCNVGKTCIVNDDCKSGICDGNVCQDKKCETNSDCSADETCEANTCVSCSDGKQNQDETDIDCGGMCAASSKRCAIGKKCNVATDCESGSCVGNVCAAAEFKIADPKKLVINEVLDVSKSTPNFALNNDVKACEFVEIANPDDEGYKLDGLKLGVQREDKEGAYEIDLSGNVIQPKSLVVVHNCESLPLPEKVVAVKSADLSIVGSGTYSFSLISGETAGDKVTVKFAQYVSSYNREIDFNINANMNKTTAIGKNAASATPGYCLNGGLYHEGCVTHCANGQKDADESGVDCGGALCEKCQDDGECKDYKDCAGGFCYKNPNDGYTDDKGVHHDPEYGTCEVCEADSECKETNAVCKKDPIYDENGDDTGKTNNYCVVPETCSDKIRNQDETEIDCGGICGAKCKVGQVCGSSADCMSAVCEDGLCAGTDPVKADLNALVINEIYDSNSSSPNFPLNRNNTACEFVEIANVSDSNISLEGLKLVVKKTLEVANPTKIELNGALDAKKILLVHSCKDNVLDYPQNDVRTINRKSTFLSGKNTYNLYIEDESGNTTYAVDFDNTEVDSTSSMNHAIDFEPTSEMVKTTSISGAAAFATPGYCTNGGLLSLNCQNYCSDTILNGNESAVDCGGNCSPCELGKNCLVKSDCESGVCRGNVCSKCSEDKQCESGSCNTQSGMCETEPTCDDKKQNQDETDVDCGGSCKVCALGQKCKVASDCETNECTDGVCTGEKPDSADVTKLLINEVMGSPKSGTNFAIQSDTAQCEFVEILNLDSKTVSVNGLKLMLLKDEAVIPSSVSLSGSIPAKGVLVVSEKEIPMPTDGVNVSATLSMSNKVSYTLWIENEAGDKASTVQRVPLATGNGKSQNRNPDMDTTNEELAWHDTVSSSGLFNSPGYCANGGTFSSGCKVDCGNHGESCGGICAPCENGKKCSDGKDCVTGQCEGGVCAGNIAKSATASDLLVNEVMLNDKKGSSTFVYNEDGAICKFVEIVNISSDDLDISSCSITIQRKDAEKKSTTALSGTVGAKQPVVVHNCSELSLPSGALGIKMSNASNLAQSAYGEAYITCGSEEGAHVTVPVVDNTNAGTSVNLPTDMVKADALVLHSGITESNNVNASPGYCVNGKLFSNDCK